MSLKIGVAVAIVRVKRLGGYRLELRFSDGHVAVVDFGPFLRSSQNPETRRFLDGKRFREFVVLHGNLVWGDYAMCFPIADLYGGCIDPAEPVAKPLAVAEAHGEYVARRGKRRR
jgi:hypothetical protein